MNAVDFHQLEQLKELEKAWAQTFPRRSSGGINAIAGFRYQYLLFLLQLVRNWLTLNEIDRVDCDLFLSSMETLSDIVEISNGLIIATQSKLSLTSGTLRDSLEEFVSILIVANKEFPQLVEKLRFRILANRKQIKDIERSALDWSIRVKEKYGDLTELVLSKLSINDETHPESQLLALLVNDLGSTEPLITIHKWLGNLLVCSKSVDLLQQAGWNIWNDLISLFRSKKTGPGIYVWQSGDHTPEFVRPGNVLTGQRPTVRHLREGYFSERNEVYDSLEKQLITWINTSKDAFEDKIPLFWIGGRSGSGKTVALIHMLSRLSEIGCSPVLWIDHHTSLLVEATQFCLKSYSPYHHSIIGVDDPYVVNGQEGTAQDWNELFASLHVLRQNEGIERLPWLIASGPTEQADRLRADLGEYLKVQIIQLPPESIRENHFLRDWYLKRTGNPAPDVGNENVLMVQLFFEWEQHSSMSSFSIRLRKRLLEGDPTETIFNLISRICALNSLYVGYPNSAVKMGLTAQQKNLLSDLEEELHLGEREQGAFHGYWLLHSHLANALYLNWHKKDSVVHMDHLKQGIIECLLSEDKPNNQVKGLSAVTQIFRPMSSDLNQRVDRKIVAVMLTELYDHLGCNYFDRLKTDWLPAWIDVQAWGELALSPSPILIGIDILNYATHRNSWIHLICIKLLNHFNKIDVDNQKELVDSIILLLNNGSDLQGWFDICEQLLLITADQRLLPIICAAVTKDARSDLIPYILKKSLDFWPENKILLETSTNCFHFAPCIFSWGDIAKRLIQIHRDIPKQVSIWLIKNSDKDNICFALSEALKTDYENFESVALSWSNTFHLSRSANYVLEPLLERRPKDPDISNWCRKWLALGVGEQSYIIQHLLQSDIIDSQLITYATNWLSEVGHKHPSWTYVWEALSSIDNSLVTLQLGLEWLKTNIVHHNGWPFLWSIIYEKNLQIIDLDDLGKAWLTNNMKHKSWLDIWLKLIDKTPKDPLLESLIEEWLTYYEIENDTDLSIILKRSNEALPVHQGVIDIGLKWLYYTDLFEPNWPYVWQKFFSIAPNNRLLYSKGIKWLKKNDFNNSAWAYVWRLLIENEPRNIELINLGINWLETISLFNSGWPYVWQRLSNIIVRGLEIETLGRNWIITVKEHKAWGHVYKRLRKMIPNDQDIIDIGFRTLRNLNSDHQTWPHVWIGVSLNTTDPEIIHLGLEWLNNRLFDNSVWIEVWEPLFHNNPKLTDLLELALEWVLFSPRTNNRILVPLMKIEPKRTVPITIKILKDYEINQGVWQTLWTQALKSSTNESLDRKNLLILGFGWLKTSIKIHGAWAVVWLTLFKNNSNNAEILQIGYDWLIEIPITHGQWPEICIKVFPEIRNKRNLTIRCLEWLRLGFTSQHWPIIYLELESQDSSYIQMGLSWAEFSFENLYWCDIWLRIYSITPYNQQLLELGRKWIQSCVNKTPKWATIFTIVAKSR